MGTGAMRIEWADPVSVHVILDATDPLRSELKRSGDGPVMLLLGSALKACVRVVDAAGAVRAEPGSANSGVVAVEVGHAEVGHVGLLEAERSETPPPQRADDWRAESKPEIEPQPQSEPEPQAEPGLPEVEDTIISADGINDLMLGDDSVQAPDGPGREADVDDTVLGQPAAASDADVDDTVLGQPAAGEGSQGGVDVDDTIIGAGHGGSPMPPTPTFGFADVFSADSSTADTVIGSGRRPAPPVEYPVPGQAAPSQPRPTGIPSLPPIPAPPSAAAPAPRTRIAAPGDPASAACGIRVPDGRILWLDRTVYVGRAPRSPRITSGEAPELITVASPLREVSGTHVEIHQEGRAVVVRDVGSTNGTMVLLPGRPATLLSPGESLVVSPGTGLDIGDGNVLEVVPAPSGQAPHPDQQLYPGQPGSIETGASLS